jgi:hypothetical protein
MLKDGQAPGPGQPRACDARQNRPEADTRTAAEHLLIHSGKPMPLATRGVAHAATSTAFSMTIRIEPCTFVDARTLASLGPLQTDRRRHRRPATGRRAMARRRDTGKDRAIRRRRGG